MTKPFKVGDRVVCVDARGYERFIVEGESYTVRASSLESLKLSGVDHGGFFPKRFTHAKPEPITDTCIMPSAPELVGATAKIATPQTELDRWIRQSQRLETLNSELTTQLDEAKHTLALAEKLIAKQALRIAELETK